MSDRSEIQAAIRHLPRAEVMQLKQWLDKEFQPEPSDAYKEWIKKAAGAGIPGVTTAEIMELTRGE